MFIPQKTFRQNPGLLPNNFQPAATHHFIMSWALPHLIFDRTFIKYLLPEQQALGAHTDIIQFQNGTTTTFRWTHPGARPMGMSITKQCPKCKKLKTRSVKPNEDTSQKVTLRCSGCNSSWSYAMPSGWQWVHQAPSKGDERGGLGSSILM